MGLKRTVRLTAASAIHRHNHHSWPGPFLCLCHTSPTVCSVNRAAPARRLRRGPAAVRGGCAPRPPRHAARARRRARNACHRRPVDRTGRGDLGDRATRLDALPVDRRRRVTCCRGHHPRPRQQRLARAGRSSRRRHDRARHQPPRLLAASGRRHRPGRRLAAAASARGAVRPRSAQHRHVRRLPRRAHPRWLRLPLPPRRPPPGRGRGSVPALRLPRRADPPRARAAGRRAQLVRDDACRHRPGTAVQRGVRRRSSTRCAATCRRPSSMPCTSKPPAGWPIRPLTSRKDPMYEIPKPELLDPDRVTRDDREDFTPADHRSQAQLLGKALGDSCAYADQLWEQVNALRAYLLDSLPPDPRRPGPHTTASASPTGPDDDDGWARWMNAFAATTSVLCGAHGDSGFGLSRAREEAQVRRTAPELTLQAHRPELAARAPEAAAATGAGPSRDRTQDCLGRDRESSRHGRTRCPRAARAATDTASSPHRGDPVGDVEQPRSARPDPARSAGTRRRMRSGRPRRHDRQPEARAGRAAQLSGPVDFDASNHVVTAATAVLRRTPRTRAGRSALFLLVHWGYGSAVARRLSRLVRAAAQPLAGHRRVLPGLPDHGDDAVPDPRWHGPALAVATQHPGELAPAAPVVRPDGVRRRRRAVRHRARRDRAARRERSGRDGRFLRSARSHVGIGQRRLLGRRRQFLGILERTGVVRNRLAGVERRVVRVVVRHGHAGHLFEATPLRGAAGRAGRTARAPRRRGRPGRAEPEPRRVPAQSACRPCGRLLPDRCRRGAR